MKEKLLKFISIVGDIKTAAIILDISTITLKNYIAGKATAESFYQKNSLVIDSSIKDLIKILASKIKYLKDDVKEQNVKIQKLNIENYRHELSKEQLSKNLERVIKSPLIKYIDFFRYNEDPIKQLEDAIDKTMADDKYPVIYLYHALEDYAKVYELFRPFPITSRDYYHGTVNKMDGIYNTIYGILFRIKPKVFSSVIMYSFLDRYEEDPYAKYSSDQIDWTSLKKDLSIISGAIRDTMNEESIRLFISLDKNISYRIEDFVKDYIKSFLKDIEEKEIEVKMTADKAIIIKGERIFVESEHELRSILKKMQK